MAASLPKPKRACKWKAEWSRFNIAPSKRDSAYVICHSCSTEFSIAGGGVHEIKRHMETKRHKERATSLSNQSTITSSLFTAQKSLSEQVTTAEFYYTAFIAEHNLSFATADHFTKLCKVMFPDSKIAESYSCGRTKTQAIIKQAIAPVLNDQVTMACKTSHFSILCDGGNDQDVRKFFAIMVRYWSEHEKQAVTRFLAMPVCNIATGETMFEVISEELDSRSIPWDHLIGYASDTASVMVGKHNSVLSRILQKRPKVFSLGFVCHLAALCATAGLKKLPVSIDTLLIDIYCHFKYSAKRWAEYMELQEEFEDIKPLKFLKQSTTRWLSLERCIKRLIEKWPALYAYFDREASEGSNIERADKIAKQLRDPLVKLLCHFVAFVLKPLNRFSTAFQTNASRIGSLQSDVRGLLKSYMCNLIKPDVFKDVADITTLDYLDPDHQAVDDELGIGTTTRLLLSGELEDEVCGTSVERKFFKCVRSFYEATDSTVEKILPI